ncbi:kinase-like domain-containing protein [Chaetomium sp. MPI-SDFR-AT-0129]|nr:kinase-like domain-containing protein [Chaetomium sp. MPI-SDFR-AT-0129]
MDDTDGGWQTVMPTSHAAMKRLPHAQLEECERKILADWEASRSHWSGVGKHLPLDDFTEAKKLHNRLKLACDTPLGSGTFGVVQKVEFQWNGRSICLARKQVRPQNRRQPMSELHAEASLMEKLDHEHIVKLVGTYCIQSSLYLLLWPVAVCSLDILINDIDNLRADHGDREDIIHRLQALDLKDLSAIDGSRTSAAASPTNRDHCPLEYLRRIMGCITRAIAFCHISNIRHLDLKPTNILLNPGRVYLADFGVSKDVHGRDNTMTRGMQGTPKWRAPELEEVTADWSMKAADVYSLGLVLLNIFLVVHNAPLDEFDAVLATRVEHGRAHKVLAYLPRVESLALATQEVGDAAAPTFGPKHIIHLITKMLAIDPSERPVIFDVDSELTELGGLEQIYHTRCCKRSNRVLTERVNTKLRIVMEERDRIRADYKQVAKRLHTLEAMKETYESRLVNERKMHAENIMKMQIQLEAERNARKLAEASLAEMQQGRRQPRPNAPRTTSDRPLMYAAHIPTAPAAMAKRPAPVKAQTHPAPVSQLPPPTTQVRPASPAPSLTNSPRPRPISYSQAAASGVPTRRVSLIPSPAPSAAPPASPSLEQVGYPLRSRNSGSRLPRAINPTRSSTPLLNRDQSSTDSTQYSMSDSVFSRMSQSRLSVAETSVAGTPMSARSPATPNTRRDHSPTTIIPPSPNFREPTTQVPTSPIEPHGLGLGLTDRERRESFASETGTGIDPSERAETESIRDTASVLSSAGAPLESHNDDYRSMLSPVPSGSALSSPRMEHASPETVTAVRRVPALPSAKSWADVARRQRNAEQGRMEPVRPKNVEVKKVEVQ